MNNELVIKKVIGRRIKEIRDKRELTQAELAEKLDCSNKYISEIERGQVNISLKKLVQLSDVLETDISYFLTGEVSEELITKIERLSDRDKKAVETLIDVLLEK